MAQAVRLIHVFDVGSANQDHYVKIADPTDKYVLIDMVSVKKTSVIFFMGEFSEFGSAAMDRSTADDPPHYPAPRSSEALDRSASAFRPFGRMENSSTKKNARLEIKNNQAAIYASAGGKYGAVLRVMTADEDPQIGKVVYKESSRPWYEE